MNRKSLGIAYKNFNRQVITNMSLVRSMEKIRDYKGAVHLKESEFFSIIELSFIKVYLAWENFLEETFILLMLGKNKKLVKYVSPKDQTHALELLKEGREYPEWTKIDVILRKAEMLFKNGNPYKRYLNQINTEIKDMTAIRNSIVHRSDSSRTKFDNLVRSSLGNSPKNLTPGEFLFKTKTGANITYLQDYLDKLDYVAGKISSYN